MSDNVEDKVTPQYQHIKELSQLKYEAEEKREQSLIQQASQMQTVFSFITAAVFMAVPVCMQYRGELSLKFFFISISFITTFILFSLIFASIAQWRWKTKSFPDVEVIKKSVLENPEWEKTLCEYNRIDQWINLVAIVQNEKARLNDRRVKLIMTSMICFFCSVITIAISFIVAVSIMI